MQHFLDGLGPDATEVFGIALGLALCLLLLDGTEAFEADDLAGQFGERVDDGRVFIRPLLKCVGQGYRIKAVEQSRERPEEHKWP